MHRLSIVIPCYNESPKIARDISAAAAFLKGETIDGEIIIVDDGSSDGTAEAARKAAPGAGVPARVIANPDHRGKGHAVATGIRASTGRTVMFADAGLTVPFDNALPALNLIESGLCSIAHASRFMWQSRIGRPQSIRRRILSRTIRIMVRILFPEIRGLSDTQCGFKMYQGDLARELFAECRNPRFLFDIEIALRALKRGKKIVEFPVVWSCDRDSRLTVSRNSAEILADLLRLYHLTRSSEFRTPQAAPAPDSPPHR
jgi:dolichyl-phosphate beta-glucosyltransferase